ncbi:MAG: LacI family DNA-binding transcriptional regulator [Bacteroidetes bacterium]|nr:LacI family DNA-binding transcriptional regulator [Fibrella sp.]
MKPKKSSVTIKEIAHQLGLSKSTVSRALHDSSEISLETKQKIMALVEKLDYLPNPVALSLLKSRSYTLGVLVPEIDNPFFSAVISGIEEVAYNRGYHVTIYQSHECYEREVLNVKHIYTRRADGLIVSISIETTTYDHFARLQENAYPMVFFDRVWEESDVDKVVVDDFDGAYKATEHLIQQGCRRIAHLAGPETLAIGQKRLHGYRAAMVDNNLSVPDEYIVRGDLTTEGALRVAGQLLDRPDRPDGIFSANDRMALGLHLAIRQRGLTIPDDLALIGFTNLPMATLIDPPLSSMVQPAVEMGQTAARLLIERIENEGISERVAATHVLKTTLLARQSSLRLLKV